ncbi:MAG: HEPN domain-containing protein [Cytophagaceae bacterium]|nr:MAG: HEPN domain-containing protein [Cytophagaceae bacterium]
MNEQLNRFLKRAVNALEDASYLHRDRRVRASANRIYYATFYCLSALLLTERITTRKHEDAWTKFHELFVKTGRFSREAGQILERNFAARQSADYDMESELGKEEAIQLLNGAKTFYALTTAYFDQNPVR